jgi:hypothetical protein
VSGHKGFAPIKDKKQIQLYQKQKKLVVIPPGHILVFYENILHEVLSKKTKKALTRVFLAWRLTTDRNHLYFENIDMLLKNQSIMQLKSLQQPPMYAKLHWTNWRNKIEHFSQNIIDECKEVRVVQSGKDKGKSYHITRRYLPPISELTKVTNHYTKREFQMYKPNRTWVLLKPFKARLKQSYSLIN